MPKKYPIFRDLKESEFIYSYSINGTIIRFHFSTDFNFARFADSVESYIEENSAKLFAKYQIEIDVRLFLSLALYHTIERRGCYVVVGNTEVTKWHQVGFDSPQMTKSC